MSAKISSWGTCLLTAVYLTVVSLHKTAAFDCPTTSNFASGFEGYSEHTSGGVEAPHWYASAFFPPGVAVADSATHGNYLYVRYIPSPTEDMKTSLLSPTMKPPKLSGTTCQLQFSMTSQGIPLPQFQGKIPPLVVFLNLEHSSRPLYKSTNFSASWERVKLDIVTNETFQVRFTVNVMNGITKTFIAIDDVVFSPGCCEEAQAAHQVLLKPSHEHKACCHMRFEQGLGDFTQAGGHWKTGKEYLYHQDGAFAYVLPFTSAKKVPTTSRREFRLLSPHYAASSSSSPCYISFKVNLYNFEGPKSINLPPSSMTLSLLLITDSENSTIFEESYQASKNGKWLEHNHTLNSTQPFQIVFVATVNAYYCVIGLDDVVFSSGCCARGKKTTNQTTHQSGGLRLVGGKIPNTGRLEVNHDGVWGTVCDDKWDLTDATVACSQLGYHLAAIPSSKTDLPSRGDIWMDAVECKGSEGRLDECRFVGWGGTDCIHDEDVFLMCIPRNYTGVYEGAVRLHDGSYNGTGKVEVHLNGIWQPVCQPQFTISAAKVLCHQLGYSDDKNIALSTSYTALANTKGLEFDCTGHEPQLMACKSQPSLACHRHGQVSVSCLPPPSKASKSSVLDIAIVVSLLTASMTIVMCLGCCVRKHRRGRIHSQRSVNLPLTTINMPASKDEKEAENAEYLQGHSVETHLRPAAQNGAQNYAVNGFSMYNQQLGSSNDDDSSDDFAADDLLLPNGRR